MNTQDEQERFEERAAILEYCAHLPRVEAERQARELARRAAAPLVAVAAPAQGDLKPCAAAALNEAKRMLKA
jgi:hypothetical protein